MHSLLGGLGNLLVCLGVAGVVWLVAESWPKQPAATGVSEAAGLGGSPAQVSSDPPSVASAFPLVPNPSERPLPITRVVISRIGLDAEVVPAAFVERDGVATWDVPPFKAGHAAFTAGAGERGNAVLLGHVTSLHSGDVFRNLDQAQLGDSVDVFSTTRRFVYEVAAKQAVPRTDVSVVETTEWPSLTLITCTGVWLPTTWDYTQRLVVRADLVAGDLS